MRYISHRGNLTGPKTALYGENHPRSIEEFLRLHPEEDIACEVDVWWQEGKGFYLGHDKPEYPVDKTFFRARRIFTHCKDIQSFYLLKLEEDTSIKAFFHQRDDVVQISNSKCIWSFPRAEVLLTPLSIAVLPELVPNWAGLNKCAGVCTDYPIKLQDDINFKSV